MGCCVNAHPTGQPRLARLRINESRDGLTPCPLTSNGALAAPYGARLGLRWPGIGWVVPEGDLRDEDGIGLAVDSCDRALARIESDDPGRRSVREILNGRAPHGHGVPING